MKQTNDSMTASQTGHQDVSPYIFNFHYMPLLFIVSALVGYVCFFSGPALVALACGLAVLFSFVSSISNIASAIKRNQTSKCLAPALETLLYLIILGILIPAGIGHVKAARNYYRKIHPGEVMPWERKGN